MLNNNNRTALVTRYTVGSVNTELLLDQLLDVLNDNCGDRVVRSIATDHLAAVSEVAYVNRFLDTLSETRWR